MIHMHVPRVRPACQYSLHVAAAVMDMAGECSSPTGSGAALLPLFGPSSAPAESLEEKLRRVSEENRRLTDALDAILADRPHLRAAVLSTAPAPTSNNVMAATEEPRPRVRTVRARAEPSDAEANLVHDGYQWRKYGQKVTRDNPYPRAYFRCAYAPSCPVKKKVQRSAEDATMLVAQYEGEHNHAQCAQSEFASCDASTSQPGTSAHSLPCSISINSLGRTITLGLTNQGSGPNTTEAALGEAMAPEFRKVLVDELVDFLKNDAEFMESLTSAVTARMMDKISADGIF